MIVPIVTCLPLAEPVTPAVEGAVHGNADYAAARRRHWQQGSYSTVRLYVVSVAKFRLTPPNVMVCCPGGSGATIR